MTTTLSPVGTTPVRRSPDEIRRDELSAFLRSRRERIAPQQVGVAYSGRRRTPGLRREEVAQLAGVGVTWYTWLEQGRDIRVSEQVLEAIARTLMLDRDERAHLFTLAGASDQSLARECAAVSPQLHALLAQLRDAGASAVAMEVSSHALHQGRVDGVHFNVAVFTNLTRDHLDYHGDMRAYGEAKARLFQWPGLRAAVLNLDDAFGRELLAALPPDTRGIGVSSRGAQADVRAENIVLDAGGIVFDLLLGDARFELRSPLLGRFNVDNLLAVAGTLHALGDAPAAIADTLAQLKPVAGRMTRLGGDGVLPLVVIDYAHTPDALEQALASLRAHAHGRLVCVFGCGGERDRGKRPQMAAIAERGADRVIVTDDNPRSEDGDAIVAEVMAGFADAATVIVERDRAAAIARAIGAAGPGDIVLIAGKGHEPYQEIGGVRQPFDDVQVAARALSLPAEPRA